MACLRKTLPWAQANSLIRAEAEAIFPSTEQLGKPSPPPVWLPIAAKVQDKALRVKPITSLNLGPDTASFTEKVRRLQHPELLFVAKEVARASLDLWSLAQVLWLPREQEPNNCSELTLQCSRTCPRPATV
ncbi:hypothetical protein CB1_000473001 [Camelus ferus]|nr:hypothetical protein CB1_000473001 [Camelus ferus]